MVYSLAAFSSQAAALGPFPKFTEQADVGL